MTTVLDGPIDTDSHVIEPVDLWTSRVSSKWGDAVPHVRYDHVTDHDVWYIGDRRMSPAAYMAMVGWKELFPNHPRYMSEVPKAAMESTARLELLDEAGIRAQVLYPNLIGGFFANRFMEMNPQLALECIRAYNDYITEFCSVDPNRLIALTALPFWDTTAAVAELERCLSLGHRGVLFAHSFDKVGLPDISDEHWAPILDAAQSNDVSINFHVGFAADVGGSAKSDTASILELRNSPRRDVVNYTASSFLSNTAAINQLTIYGVCDRYPRLKFVCVESGFGFIPYQLQALDWQWIGNGMREDEPNLLLPSEYFKRQILATMWFERPAVSELEEFQDNVMWESDYPHPTAQWPTPKGIAMPVSEALDYSFAGLSDTARAKITWQNAARLYHLDAQ